VYEGLKHFWGERGERSGIAWFQLAIRIINGGRGVTERGRCHLCLKEERRMSSIAEMSRKAEVGRGVLEEQMASY
jgi:hypothetical protein